MKTNHVLTLTAILALSGILMAQTSTSGSSQTSTSSSSSSSRHSSGSSQSSGGTSIMGDLKDKRVFAVINEPGENWAENKPIHDQDLDGHIAYMQDLLTRGILVMGGPFMDNTGGEYVIVAKDLKEAQAIVANDPGYRSGVLDPEVHEWYLPFKSPALLAAIGGTNVAIGQSGR